MTNVRYREKLTSKEHARKRRETKRVTLAPDPASPGGRSAGALDWFRAAAVYAGRRTYRTLSIGEAAIARRDRLRDDAGAMLQEHACRIDAIVPPDFRRPTRRAEFRAAYAKAKTAPERREAGRAWFMFMIRQAGRCGGEVALQAARIEDEATVKLIEWAEEMDADDYGE